MRPYLIYRVGMTTERFEPNRNVSTLYFRLEHFNEQSTNTFKLIARLLNQILIRFFPIRFEKPRKKREKETEIYSEISIHILTQ